jgi:hypothetical protein
LRILKIDARERLRQLIEMGYLTSVRYRFEQKNYYIGTKYAFYLIHYMKPSRLAAKPIQQIDVGTFDHDIQVLKSRLLIEESEQGTDWINDRQLKCLDPEFYRRYRGDATPDGVYTSQNGKAIAFEFEIARKSKQRYRNKLRRYTYNI